MRWYQNGANCLHNGLVGTKFQGAQRDCLPCELRDKCLRTPDKTKTRQVCFFRGKADLQESATDRMKRAIDSERGRELYGQRFATVEPVFGNLQAQLAGGPVDGGVGRLAAGSRQTAGKDVQ
jgi:hypothetical protein